MLSIFANNMIFFFPFQVFKQASCVPDQFGRCPTSLLVSHSVESPKARVNFRITEKGDSGEGKRCLQISSSNSNNLKKHNRSRIRPILEKTVIRKQVPRSILFPLFQRSTST